MRSQSREVRIGAGLVAGLAIAAVDNFAFGGETSPIVIVLMLFATCGVATMLWGRGGWTAAVAAWLCVPLAHVIKHVLGLPDSLHPNTYGSILMLAGFTLLVSVVGAAAGIVMFRTFRSDVVKPGA